MEVCHIKRFYEVYQQSYVEDDMFITQNPKYCIGYFIESFKTKKQAVNYIQKESLYNAIIIETYK